MMWMWILIGLVTKVHGYANTPFPQSCDSMSPKHYNRQTGDNYKAQDTDSPYEVSCEPGNKGEPTTVHQSSVPYESSNTFTVTLRSTTGENFRGFLLEAREQDRVDGGHAVGKFILLEPDKTRLFTCGAYPDSAVMQKNNVRKSLVKVNWTAEGNELNVIFRATFAQSFDIFWEHVNSTLCPENPSATTSTMKPITTDPSTTEPSSTKPSTVESSTAQLSTTKPSTTEPSMTTLPTVTSITSSTSTNSNRSCDGKKRYSQAGIALMCFDSLVVVLKMELSNIITTIYPSSLSYLPDKWMKTPCSVLCATAEVLALIFFYLGGPSTVILPALTIALMVINFTKLLIISLPFGPSHELKGICDVAFKICSVIHLNFTTAVIFVGVLEIDNCRMNRKECWLLKVMVAYTVWIFLFVIWVFVYSIHRQTILGRRQIGNLKVGERWKEQGTKWRFRGAQLIVNAVSVILIAGTLTFTVAIIYGTFGSQKM